MAYSVSVRDSMMIAHSFKGEVFGPAQKLHGATFTVDTKYSTDSLDSNNIVIDIGLAMEVLKEVLKQYNYKNLDEIEKFKGQNTTTEFMCKAIFEDVKERVKGKFSGQLKVTIHESHIAWGSYKGKV